MKKDVFIVILFILVSIIIKTDLIMGKICYPDLTGQKLVVYITFHEEEGRRLLDLFKEKTNCQYIYLRMPAGETAERVIDEATSPAADIVLGGPADVHQLLANKGLLEKYISPISSSIPIKYKDSEGYWTGLYIGPISIGINGVRWEKELAGKGINKPKSFNDLLDPVFKGEIIMPAPLSSGTGYTLLASLIQLWGEDKTILFLKQLDKNVAEYSKSGFTVAQRVAVGEYLIGINFLHDQLLMRKSGFNIVSRVPEGAGWEIGGISIVRNGPNTRAAQAFVDFMLSKEIGQFHTDLTERISTREDVRMPISVGLVSLSEMPINWGYDFSIAAENRVSYQQLWEATINENYDY